MELNFIKCVKREAISKHWQVLHIVDIWFLFKLYNLISAIAV